MPSYSTHTLPSGVSIAVPPGAVEPSRESPLSNAFHSLIGNIVSLEETATRFEHRLAAVCSPAVPTTSGETSGDPMGSQGAVVDGLHASNRRITEVLGRLDALERRLSV